MSRRALVLGLNEFNTALLEQGGRELQLPHLSKVLRYNRSRTLAADTYESGFLEPWCQWVCVQTGLPTSDHRIKHLGDVPNLKYKQIWEALSEHGISSGVWGAMNANKGTAEQCRFFFPDPWTFSENGYPSEISQLLQLPRYISKNYLNLSFLRVAKLLPSFFGAFFKSGLGLEVMRSLPGLIKDAIKFKGQHFVFISYTDLLSTKLFLKYRNRFRPDFSFIFLNSIAHLQHHHWVGSDLSRNERLRFGLQIVDHIVGDLMAELAPDEIFLILNGLSQKNTNDEPDWILYRQKEHSSFLSALGVFPEKIEPHMTHDAHLFFKSESECECAYGILSNVSILGKKFFLVEKYPDDKNKLFYRIDFTDPVPPGTSLLTGKTSIDFASHFRPIVKRTGKHIPQGMVFFRGMELPDKMMNFELAEHLLREYGIHADHS